MNNFPLQTANNCCAFSYWVALRVALQLADPYRKITFTEIDVEKVIGAPALTNGIYQDKMMEAFPLFNFRELYVILATRDHPITVVTWDQDFSHAVCLLPNNLNNNPGYGYDPAHGNTDRTIDITKCARPVEVTCKNPESFPYARWYWKFALGRFLIKPDLFK